MCICVYGKGSAQLTCGGSQWDLRDNDAWWRVGGKNKSGGLSLHINVPMTWSRALPAGWPGVAALVPGLSWLCQNSLTGETEDPPDICIVVHNCA